MKIENIDQAVRLKKEIDQLNNVKYIIDGGGRFIAKGNGNTFENIIDRDLCIAMLDVIAGRIKQIESIIETL